MDNEKQTDTMCSRNEDCKIECRACLQIFETEVDNSLVNIFQAWTPPWDGMEATIAEDLAKIANIKVEETDIHSKVICNMCHQKLREACIFTTVVHTNDAILRQRYPDQNTDSDKIWPKPIQITNINGYGSTMNIEVKQEVLSDEEYGNTNGVDENYLDFEIKIEPEEIIPQTIQISAVNGSIHLDASEVRNGTLTNGNDELQEDDFGIIIKEEPLSEGEESESPTDLPLECMLCARAFNSVSGLKSHVIAQHSYKSVKRKSESSPSPKKVSKVHNCTTCRRSFATPTDLIVHETCHNQYTCYGCNEKFDTFSSLATHRLECLKSNGTTVKHKTLDDVKRPKLEVTPEQDTLRCKECNQQFSDPFYLSVHMEVHEPSGGLQNDSDTPVAMETQSLEDIFTGAT